MPQKKGDDKEQNIFILNSLYPEANSVFSFKPRSLEEIRNTCLVVLDTNVLLVPFDTGQESLQQIKETYQDLVQAKRLVIPGRVAREFAKNRAEKLKTLYQQVSQKRNLSISRASYPLLESSEEYQKLIETEKELNSKLSDYRKQEAALLNKIRGWYWDDPVSSLYGELFRDQVVTDIEHDEDELRSDLENRTLHKIQPGFQDSVKEDKGVGDLLVWRTILELGKTRKQDVIFVTNDSKNDWRYQSDKQALYPRFELIEEYRRHSGGKTIHIINFSQLLQLFGASPEVVDEVRQEEVLGDVQETGRASKGNVLLLAEKSAPEVAVGEWIRATYSDSDVHYSVDRSLDLVLRTSNSERIGVVIKIMFMRAGILNTLKILASGAQSIFKYGMVDRLFFVCVVDEEAIKTLNLFSEFINFLPPKTSAFIGTISPDENLFIPRLHFEGAENDEIDDDQLPF